MNGASITFAGILGADPELRYTPSGSALVTMSVAVTERKQVSGKWENGETTWFKVTTWNRAAEYAAESLTRGNRVIVTGTMRAVKFADKASGDPRYSWEVTADEIGLSLKFGSATTRRAERGQGDAAGDDPWSEVSEQPPATVTEAAPAKPANGRAAARQTRQTV